MQQRLYSELAPWYRMFTPPTDYADEAAAYEAALVAAVSPAPRTLLELGAGAGHNAFHLKKRFTCTLTDLSPEMVALSEALNPECAHAVGDMRTLRLGRTFDAVLVHDAVSYMLTEEDLRAAADTAFVHLRQGGAAVFAPDSFRDDFAESTETMSAREGDRAIECLAWSFDPDPADATCETHYAFLLREGAKVTAVHDVHVEGLFPCATWRRVLEQAGFAVSIATRPRDDEGNSDDVFVCLRL